MTATPDDFARELAELVQRYGPDGLGDRKRVVAILADRLPNNGRDLRILGMAVDNGVVVALKATPADGAAVEIDRLAARLESHIGTPRSLALPMLRALAFALGRGPLPSAAAPATPAAAPPVAAAPIAATPVAAAPVATPPPAAAPRVVTPSTPALVADRVGGRLRGGLGPVLSALAVYWLIAQAYWLLTSLTALPDVASVVAEGMFGYFVYVVIGGLIIVALGAALAMSFWRRRRSFQVWLTAWLSLGALVAAYALHGAVGDVVFELDAELAAGLWPLLLPTAVSFAAAALFLPYAWLAPAVRARFVITTSSPR